MKKGFFTLAALLIAFASFAVEKTIHVVGKGKKSIGTSVVAGGGNLSDTLTVVPAEDVEAITITLKDVEGNVLYYNCVPASFEDHFTIISPELRDGFYLEVYDDKGRVYSEYND